MGIKKFILYLNWSTGKLIESIFILVFAFTICGGCSFDFSTEMQRRCTSPVQAEYSEIESSVKLGNYSGVGKLCRNYDNMHSCLHSVLGDCGILGSQYVRTVRRQMKHIRKLCRQYDRIKDLPTTPLIREEKSNSNNYVTETTTSLGIANPSTPAQIKSVGSNIRTQFIAILLTFVIII